MYVIPIDQRGSPSTWRARIGKVRLKVLSERTPFGGETTLDADPNIVLAYAMEADLSAVVIAGWPRAGGEHFATSVADGGTTLWLLERAKRALLSHGDAAISQPEPQGAA